MIPALLRFRRSPWLWTSLFLLLCAAVSMVGPTQAVSNVVTASVAVMETMTQVLDLGPEPRVTENAAVPTPVTPGQSTMAFTDAEGIATARPFVESSGIPNQDNSDIAISVAASTEVQPSSTAGSQPQRGFANGRGRSGSTSGASFGGGATSGASGASAGTVSETNLENAAVPFASTMLSLTSDDSLAEITGHDAALQLSEALDDVPSSGQDLPYDLAVQSPSGSLDPLGSGSDSGADYPPLPFDDAGPSSDSPAFSDRAPFADSSVPSVSGPSSNSGPSSSSGPSSGSDPSSSSGPSENSDPSSNSGPSLGSIPDGRLIVPNLLEDTSPLASDNDGDQFTQGDARVAQVPEPSTVLLTALGLLAAVRRHRNRQSR